MLSQTSEHALRAVLFLAQHEKDALIPADRIAAAIGAPRDYLAKTLNALAKAGVLISMRGATGGFRLAIPPGELTLERVVAPFDEPRSSGICLLGDRPCTSLAPCAAHEGWLQLRRAVWEPLRRATVAEVLRGRSIPGITASARRSRPARSARPAAM